MQRISILFCSMIVMSVGAVSMPAEAGILEFIFPSMKKEVYDPTEDMIAPFAVEAPKDGEEEAADAKKPKLDSLPVNATELDKPHILSKEVGTWVMTSAANAMNFKAGDAAAQVQGHSLSFDTTGAAQYAAFLREMNILKVIENGRYTVSSYVDQQPLLLNEGNVNGRYRWLFRVPMVVSYLEKGMTSYKDAKPTIIQRATMNVQIGRVASDGKPDGMQIEQWSGKLTPFKQK